MRQLRTIQMALALTMVTLVGNPAIAQSPTAAPKSVVNPASRQMAPFVPAEFSPPTKIETAGFKLVPLGPDLVTIDFDAYMSSIEHLQKTFSRSTDWPHANISSADAMKDMENEQARFRERKSFAYAVLTPDGRRERGSVYVSPSPVGSYDTVVRLWVTKGEYDAGFDGELYRWVANWIKTDWPFKKVAYPGRAIDWAAWDAMVAAKPAGKAVPPGS